MFKFRINLSADCEAESFVHLMAQLEKGDWTPIQRLVIHEHMDMIRVAEPPYFRVPLK